MKVYRIEHSKTGYGPFSHNLARPHHYDPPGPYSDDVFGTKGDYLDKLQRGELYKYRYGFQSKDHLLNWFTPKDIKQFQSKGMKLVEYDIPQWKVYHGGNQCAFNPKDAYKKRNIKVERVLH